MPFASTRGLRRRNWPTCACLLALLLAQGGAFSTHAIPSVSLGRTLARPLPMQCTRPTLGAEAGAAPRRLQLQLRGGGGVGPGTPTPSDNVPSLAIRASRPRSRLLHAVIVAAAAVLLPSAALAAGKTAAAAAATAGSLIQSTDSWGLWTTLIVCAAAGLRAEKTQIGAALSSPLVTMFIALVLVNVGVLPTEAPIYGAINRFLVPLAVPMLLLGADLRKVFRDTGSLLLDVAWLELGS